MRALFLFFTLATFAITSAAADRQIGFVQQQPGDLVMVSLVQSGAKTVAVIHCFGKKSGERIRPIASEDFEIIWAAFTGAEASSYIFEPGPSDNMSDVRFYTVKIVGAKKPISLRIPREEKPEVLSGAIAKIEAWIDEKG